jgi:hypothetical protein
MGLSVTFVSGPRCSGKSTLISAMVNRLFRTEPHYIRLVKSGSDKRPPKPCSRKPADCGVASARWLEYDDERIFEVLPDALTAIHRRDRYGAVVIEAEAENVLRHAYPYDHRIFLMPLPDDVRELFRDPARAADEMKRVLDDTAAFASEIFGLLTNPLSEEEVDPSEERVDLTDSQMRGFLYSPLGDELATRIQLQQPYHGLVESDVIIVNTSVGRQGPETADCLRRVERLLERVRGITGRRGELLLADLRGLNGKNGKRLFKALKPLCQTGK